ncbi:MAG: PKD domain-containing protein, partial [Salinivirgaceae bacterium]|nr:PKD domain-containing protein [Salinivirgaceae bacterium]
VYYPEPPQLYDTTICAGDVLTWNAALNGPYTYLWSDGSTESSLDITTAGEYWLIVTDSAGFKWYSDTITVAVDSFPVTVKLEGDQINSCIGNNIYLQNGYEEAVGYLWSDGSTADHLEVTESGQYWVKVTDKLGCKSADTAYISVLGVAPTPDFTHTALCATRDIEFENKSYSNDDSQINAYEWQFGDGGVSVEQNATHSYNYSGVYNLQLTVSSSNGCSNILKKTLVIDSLPTAAFAPAQACSYNDVQFTDLSTTPVSYLTEWQWTMNDSVFAEPNPRTTFSTAGDMPVQLVVSTAHGCTDTLLSSISILQGPDVDFSYSATCLKTPVYFSNRTTSAFNLSASYQWLIDDEEKSTMRSPNFTFNDTGTYKISLTARQLANGCVATKSRYISILPPPDVRISAGLICQNQPTEITATNIEPGNIVSQWVWTFDNETKINGQAATISFEKEGKHNISVTATDTVGCTDRGDTTIVVRPTPTAQFAAMPARGPVPFETELLNQSTNADSYEWHISDGATSQAEELAHTFADSGTFRITLVAKNLYGCADTINHIVTAIVPNTDLVLINAESDLSDGYISISALVANNSPYDLANTVINWTDNLGHNVREVIADTIKSGKIYHYTFSAKIGADTPNRLKYICVNVEPTVNDDNTPDNNQFCITMNPNEFSIEPAKPNPADNRLKISYVIPEEGNVKIELFNQTGILVSIPFNGTASAGYNEFLLNASLLKSGMYHYRITYGGHSHAGVVMVMH